MKQNSYYLYEFTERFVGSTYRLHLYLFKKSKNLDIIKNLFEHYKNIQTEVSTNSKLFIVQALSSFEAKNTILSSLTSGLPNFSGKILEVK